MGYAFERVGLHRIQLDVYAHNHRARRVYEKVGFVEEGTRRQAQLRDGAWLDEVVMSILSHEWDARDNGSVRAHCASANGTPG